MRSRTGLFSACIAVVVGAAFIVALANRSPAASHSQTGAGGKANQNLPTLGTRLTPLPDGPGKTIAEGVCLPCHSSDIIRQQRLTRQQWTATIAKMVNWGAGVPEAQKETLIEYLTTHFGPENASFQPVIARPVRR